MERVSLLKVGAVCAILYIIVIVVALILGSAIGALDAEDAAELLPIMEEDQAVAGTVSWLFVLAPILIAVAGLGFFHALRQAGPSMWIALLAFSGGGLLIVYRGSIFVAMTFGTRVRSCLWRHREHPCHRRRHTYNVRRHG